MTSSIGPDAFRHLAGHFATGVTIVTTFDATGAPCGMTANSFASVSLEPPLISVAVDHAATIYPAMLQAPRFAVNILEARQESLSRRFADGLEDRFDGVAWERSADNHVILAGTLAHLRCDKWAAIPAGDHTIFVGRVTGGSAAEQGTPLLHYRGGYVDPSSLVSRLSSLPVSSLRFSPIGAEALDDPGTDPALVTRLVADIAVCNRWLGGTLAMRFGLARLLEDSDRGHRLTLFDIGTGAADLPRDARRFAARRGVSLVPVALERIPAAAHVARRAGVPVILGCASALPLRPKSVDVVLLSQMVHHLDAESAVQLLAACTSIARRGVVVADLHRTWFAVPGFRLAGVLLGLHRVTIDDGVTSIRRGFSTGELRALGVRAGARNVAVAARPGSRVVAWWRTDQ